MRHRILTAALLAAALTSTASLATGGAQAAAGTYQVTACNAAPAAANNSWVWSSTDPSASDHYSQYTNCPDRIGGSGGTTDQQGGLSSADTLGLTNGAPPGTSAGWTFTAAPNTQIEGITYERYLGHRQDPDNYWSPALRTESTIVPSESCEDTVGDGENCYIGGPPDEGVQPATITGLSAHQLSLSIVCQAPAGQECITGATLHKVWAALYGATVTISDPTPPMLSSPSGSLWENGTADSYHKGNESLTVEADDIGGGVQSIILAADGQQVATYAAPCNFTYPQPCPSATGPQTLTLPTSELSDGTHTLTLVALDAAGNESTLASKQITVDNTGPAAPVDLAATPTSADPNTFTVTWADPSGQVAPITQATYQVCPSGSAIGCSTPEQTPPAGPATVSVPGPGTWTLTVWLTDQAGNGSSSSAARISLTVPASSGGGETTKPGGGERGGEPGKSGGSGKPKESGGQGLAGKQPSLHISDRLNGDKLIVRVSGHNGRVRVSYIARRGHRRIAGTARTGSLKHGHLRVVFKLSHRAANSTITVTAKMPNQPLATSRFHRHLRAKSQAITPAATDYRRIQAFSIWPENIQAAFLA